MILAFCSLLISIQLFKVAVEILLEDHKQDIRSYQLPLKYQKRYPAGRILHHSLFPQKCRMFYGIYYNHICQWFTQCGFQVAFGELSTPLCIRL